jgi:uncharacterized short protein YbdD (DUF466 family)
MAIDRTGISSLEVGAPDISYTGNQGPKSPEQERQMAFDDTPGFELQPLELLLEEFREDNNGQDPSSIDDLRRFFYNKYGPKGIAKVEQAVQREKQQAQAEQREGIQMASAADPMLQDEYDKYVFELQEMHPEATPMSIEQFKQEAIAGMATGGRAGYANGQRVGFRVGKGAGMERTSDTGMPDFGPPDHGPDRGDHHPPVIKPPVIRPTGDGPPPKDVWNVGTPSKTFNPGLSEQRNRLYNIRQRQKKNFLEGTYDEDREMKEKVDDWFEEPSGLKSTDSLTFAEVTRPQYNTLKSLGQVGNVGGNVDEIKELVPAGTFDSIRDSEWEQIFKGDKYKDIRQVSAEGGIARLGYANGQRVGFKGGGADAGTESFAKSLGGQSYADEVGSKYGFSGGDGGGDRHRTASEVRAEISNRTEEEKRRIREEDQKRKELIEARKQQQDSYLQKKRKENIKKFVNRSIYKDLYRANIDLFDEWDEDKDGLFPGLISGGLEAFKTYNPPKELDYLDVDDIKHLYAGGQFDPDDMTKSQRSALENFRTNLEKKEQLKATDYGDQELFNKLYPGPTPAGDGPPPIIYPYPQDVHPGTGEEVAKEIEDRFSGEPIIFASNTTAPDYSGDWARHYGADGGRIPAAYGGIMGDDGRRRYGLGSIFKKAARGIKKVLKSPIGKMALMGGLGAWGLKGLGGGGWNPMNLLSKGSLGFMQKGASSNKFLKGLLLNDENKFSPWKLGIGAASLYPLIKGMGDDEDDDFTQTDLYKRWLAQKQSADKYFAPVSDPANWQRQRLYADGGRIGYQDGNKVLPHKTAYLQELNRLYGIAPKRKNAQEGGLMDMGGMEKDYRNDGGFVPIGGQERADDVPARLSKNEFVFTADAVRAAGGGDIDKGAEIMENVMENLEEGGNISEESQGLEGARNMFATSQRLEGVL